ncbi:MAG: pentapeptide repeat-containing protein, partial [Frankia sp.]
FTGTVFTGTVFTGTVFTGTVFTGVDFTGTVFTGTVLTAAGGVAVLDAIGGIVAFAVVAAEVTGLVFCTGTFT